MDDEKLYLYTNKKGGRNLKSNHATIIVDRRSFDKGVVEWVEDHIEMYFFYDMYVWNDKSDVKVVNWRLPVVYSTYPSIVVEETVNGDKYHFLKYYKDDIVIENLSIQKKNDHLAKMFYIVLNNGVPDHLSYHEIATIFSGCFEQFKFAGRSAESTLEMIIATICRNPDNLSESFRFYHSDDFEFRKKHMKERILVALTEVAGFSPFSSATAPDSQKALGYSMIYKENPLESPIEQILKRDNDEPSYYDEIKRINQLHE